MPYLNNLAASLGGDEPRSHDHGAMAMTEAYGLKTAGPVFTFQAGTHVSEGCQAKQGKATGLVTSTFGTPGREGPSTRNRSRSA